MVKALAAVAVAWLVALGCSSNDDCASGSCDDGEAAGKANAGKSGAGSGGAHAGSGGAAGASGSAGKGGKGPMIECPPECLRPVNCVKVCGGPSLSNGCCPCQEPAFDDFRCGQGGGAP